MFRLRRSGNDFPLPMGDPAINKVTHGKYTIYHVLASQRHDNIFLQKVMLIFTLLAILAPAQ